MDNFELLGTTGSRDNNGIAKMTVPFYCSSRNNVFTVGPSVLNGLQETSRQFSANPDGAFTVQITYEGNGGLSGGGSDSSRTEANYQLSSSLEDAPIEAHPKILELMAKYEGTEKDGKVTFAEKLKKTSTDNNSSESGFNSSWSPSVFSKATTTNDSDKNPMFGVEKFKKLSVQWSITYASTIIPAGILNNVGKIVKPPGNPPTVSGRNRWLCMPPTANKRGNVSEITENYFLLDEKVVDELYA